MCEHVFIKNIKYKYKCSCFCERSNERNIFKNVFYINLVSAKIHSNQNYQLKS